MLNKKVNDPSKMSDKLSNAEESELSVRYLKFNLTDDEKKNLKAFKRFNNLKWFIHKQTFRYGDLLGHNEFLKNDMKNPQQFVTRTDNVMALDKTGLAVIDKQDYLNILKSSVDK